MAGGLMQLVAYGAQDVYLTGNPQITLFKVVYRRHTNFSTECIELSLDASAKPGARSTVQVLRNADLATKCYLYLTLPDLTPSNSSSFNGQVAWVQRLGHAVMSSIEVQIGGSQIDKHYSTWLDVWYELTHTVDRERGYNQMIGDVPALTTLTTGSVPSNGTKLYVPLQFWFCRNYGLALPLIALQYHEVRFNIEWETINNLVVYTLGAAGVAPQWNNISWNSASILVDYQYLDSEERRRFAQVGHEYLIEQAQYDTRAVTSTGNQSVTLNFNHPCKEFVWAHKLGAFSYSQSSNTYLGYTADGNWEKELNAIAANLAESMVTLSTVNTNTLYNWSEAISASSASPTTVILQTSGNGTFVFTINTESYTSAFYLGALKAPLVGTTTPAINLANKLQWVEMNVAVVGTSGALTINNTSVVAHTLRVVDVSTPLSSFTDTRPTSAKASDVAVTQPFNYGALLDGSGNVVQSAKLNFNGQDRFDDREGAYFNYVQPDAHHTRTPADGINVYSFGLHPEQHQPTGTANMSRIDTARLIYTFTDPVSASRPSTFNATANTSVYLMTTNYNVLRIMSGMGGLAYSN